MWCKFFFFFCIKCKIKKIIFLVQGIIKIFCCLQNRPILELYVKKTNFDKVNWRICCRLSFVEHRITTWKKWLESCRGICSICYHWALLSQSVWLVKFSHGQVMSWNYVSFCHWMENTFLNRVLFSFFSNAQKHLGSRKISKTKQKKQWIHCIISLICGKKLILNAFVYLMFVHHTLCSKFNFFRTAHAPLCITIKLLSKVAASFRFFDVREIHEKSV